MFGQCRPTRKRPSITNNDGLEISRSSFGRKQKATGSWKIACSLNEVGQRPHRRRTIQTHQRQNVAGLWLKYGAKSLKIETYLPPKILAMLRRFVDKGR